MPHLPMTSSAVSPSGGAPYRLFESGVGVAVAEKVAGGLSQGCPVEAVARAEDDEAGLALFFAAVRKFLTWMDRRRDGDEGGGRRDE